MNNTTQELSYYQKNKELMKAQARDFYKKNKEKQNAKARLYRKNNKEQINAKIRLYHKVNKEQIKFRARLQYEKNKKQINAKKREWWRIRRINNPQTKLTDILRNRVYSALKAQNTTKNKKTELLIGCSVIECKKYIENLWLPGMNWSNHTVKGWHIDHIRPCNTFNLIDPEQQKQCFHYTNLRPLWSIDNLSRPKDGRDIL
jgi:hypothetical protein